MLFSLLSWFESMLLFKQMNFLLRERRKNCSFNWFTIWIWSQYPEDSSHLGRLLIMSKPSTTLLKFDVIILNTASCSFSDTNLCLYLATDPNCCFNNSIIRGQFSMRSLVTVGWNENPNLFLWQSIKRKSKRANYESLMNEKIKMM